MDTKIEEVEQEIRKVDEQIVNVAGQLTKAATEADAAHCREKEKHLWKVKERLLKKEEQLREQLLREKELLLVKADTSGNAVGHEDVTGWQKKLKSLVEDVEMKGMSKLPLARSLFQLFVQSARQMYLEWEESGKQLLEVKGDPFADFRGAFLILVRECYVDLKKILVEEEEAKGPGKRFIVLGTAGIGKSFFSIFWVCYLATQKKRIVWKFASGSCYLLDFSQEVATAHGPAESLYHPVLLQVVGDKDSWLIIDGGQKAGVEYKCSVLLACSAKKENYHEFQKMGLARTLYLPVWTEDEIKRFCAAFVKRESEFSAMDVPDKDTALANFKELGGIPRYVLRGGKMAQGRAMLQRALGSVSVENCLLVCSGQFNHELCDMLIHMFVHEKEYTMYELDFACPDVQHLIDQHLMKIGKLHAVDFLEMNIKNSAAGTLWGHMFELVAHVILSRGGDFKRRRVSETGEEVLDTFHQKKLELMRFQTLQELTKLKDDYPGGAYCQPSSLNFESADAVIVPGTLVQYFKYRKGNHGYKVHGLTELDKALNLSNYSLWSCVPKESFEETKYQNWVTTKGTKYTDMTSEVRGLLQKMQQYVVEVDYRRYAKL